MADSRYRLGGGGVQQRPDRADIWLELPEGLWRRMDDSTTHVGRWLDRRNRADDSGALVPTSTATQWGTSASSNCGLPGVGRFNGGRPNSAAYERVCFRRRSVAVSFHMAELPHGISHASGRSQCGTSARMAAPNTTVASSPRLSFSVELKRSC